VDGTSANTPERPPLVGMHPDSIPNPVAARGSHEALLGQPPIIYVGCLFMVRFAPTFGLVG